MPHECGGFLIRLQYNYFSEWPFHIPGKYLYKSSQSSDKHLFRHTSETLLQREQRDVSQH